MQLGCCPIMIFVVILRKTEVSHVHIAMCRAIEGITLDFPVLLFKRYVVEMIISFLHETWMLCFVVGKCHSHKQRQSNTL